MREGSWALARECFAAEATAEALEGLSWAAWWQDDADTVFSAREAAFRLYRERGDAAAAARMATWIGADQRDFHGADAVGSGWLQRARRLLEPLEPGPAHGWLAFHEGYLLNAAGDGEQARRLAVEAAELGRRFGVPDLEMLGLALEGTSLVGNARVDDGMRRLDEATVIALEDQAEIPISGAWVCCFLVSACLAVYDFERAFAWSDRIARFADRYGSRWMLAFCRAEYGAVHRWRGRWGDAEAMLEASAEDFACSRPAWASGPLAGLAELRRRQGRGADALQLLERAGGSPSAQLCHAHMALDRGAPAEAAELAERLLRRLPPQRRLDRVPALELLVRARAAAAEPDAAAAALQDLRELSDIVGNVPLRAIADRAEGALYAARGAAGASAARTLLEDAIDGFESTGATYEAAEVRLELAAVLDALGRAEQAERERAAGSRMLRGLGIGDGQLPLPELTPREREVLTLLTAGLTNRQLAERLVVSEHTVHRHVSNILRKLGLTSRTAAAARAARAGLI